MCGGRRDFKLDAVEPWAATDSEPEYPDLARILTTAARWWWALALGALLGAVLAIGLGLGAAKIYQAHTKLLVGPIGGEYQVLRAAGQQAETDADLVTSDPVLRATQERLRTDRTVAQLRRDAVASADDVTRLLTITAKADGAAEAAATANALAAELIRTTRADDPASGHELTVVDPAQPPSGPVGTRAKALVVIAALAGLLAALTFVVLLDLTAGRLTSEDDLATASPAPVLGTVRRGGVSLLGAAALLGARHERIVVTAVDDDGTGARAAIALADALAAGGSQVLLVDADPGPRSLSRVLRLDRRPGLSEAMARPGVMRGSAELAALTVRRGPRTGVLPRGHTGLEPDRARGLLKSLGRRTDVIVIAAPPASGLAAVGWTHLSDGAIVVARRAHATRDRVRAAVELLERAGCPVLGAVLARPAARRLRLPSLRAHGPAAPPAPSLADEGARPA
jgi:capsular polysaccharide biosynthesis protein